MANGKIVSYIQKPYNIDVYVTKEENISSKYLLSASINKMFNIVSHITVENSPLKKAYNLQSYITTPYILTSDIVSNKDN
jgi:hypothetical protein